MKGDGEGGRAPQMGKVCAGVDHENETAVTDETLSKQTARTILLRKFE